MLKLSFLAAVLCLSVCSFAQSGKSNVAKAGESFYAEAGGPGILFSANYDRRFNKSALGLGARAGLGFVTGYESDIYTDPQGYTYYRDRRRSILSVPVQVNYIFGKPNATGAFEVGLGATFTSRKINPFENYYDYSRDRSSVYGTASFMYRRMPKDGGFSWRLGFTPLFTNGYVQASAGASVGYNF